MRQLTKKEKQYSFVFGFTVFLLLNILGFKYYINYQQQLQNDVAQYRLQEQAAQVILKDKDLWSQRKAWLEAKQPRFRASAEASNFLINLVETTAKSNGVTINNRPFLPKVSDNNTAPYQEIIVPLKVNCSLEVLIHWLTELQQPEHFVAISSLSLKSENDPSKVVCDLEAALWYAPSR